MIISTEKLTAIESHKIDHYNSIFLQLLNSGNKAMINGWDVHRGDNFTNIVKGMGKQFVFQSIESTIDFCVTNEKSDFSSFKD